MNSQIFQLIITTLTLIDVYSWILSLVGATLTSFWPEKDDTQKEIKNNTLNHITSIVAGTLFGRFFTFLMMSWFAFVSKDPPIAFLVFGLIGNSGVQFIIKLGRKLGSDKNVDSIYDLIKTFISNKFKK